MNDSRAEAPETSVDVDAAARRGVRTRLITMLLTLTAVLVLTVCAGLWVVANGSYNVAATETQGPVARWARTTLKHSAVAARAALPLEIPTDGAAVACVATSYAISSGSRARYETPSARVPRMRAWIALTRSITAVAPSVLPKVVRST